MKKLFIIALWFASSASAAKLENVSVMDVSHTLNDTEFKLHASTGPERSFFYVRLKRTDPKLFDKFTVLSEKLFKGESYKLDLDIASFSMSPSGSRYPGESVKFSGAEIK